MPYILQTIINVSYYILGVVSSFGNYLLQPISYNQQKFALDIIMPFAEDVHTIISLPFGATFDVFIDKVAGILPFDITGLPMIVVLVLVLFVFGLVLTLIKRILVFFQ